MTRDRWAAVALLAAPFLFATWLVGWWSVPLVALVSVWSSRRLVPWQAAAGASLAWLLLLGWDATGGAFAELTVRLQGLFHLPVSAMILATLMTPAVLAWSAGWLAYGMKPADD